jgi:uncharacterized protein (TIGR02246 family)
MPRTTAALLLALAALSCAPVPDDRTPKVLVIGIDGVRPDVLAEVATPALDGLVAEGSWTDEARTGFPSVSGPGWSSFLNGVWPDKHGVTDNAFGGERYAEYPDFLTRIENARPELETFAVVDWTPLARSETGAPPLSDAIDRTVVLDGYELGWLEADEASVDSAVAVLSNGDPAAAFVYLGNPDETSHQAGSIGAEYREAVAAADAHVGRLLEAVRSRATWAEEDWLVLISTDHGRRPDGGHGGDTPEERTIFFLASGPSASKGALEPGMGVVAIAPTALAHLGIDIDPAWNLDGCPTGLVQDPAPSCVPTPAAPITAPIVSILEALPDAWNRRDADAWVENFAETSGFTNILGMHFADREANRARHAELFATIFANSRLEAEVLRVRPVGGTAAVAELEFTLIGYDRLPPDVPETEPGILRTRLITMLEHRGGRWTVVAAQNTAILPAAIAARGQDSGR